MRHLVIDTALEACTAAVFEGDAMLSCVSQAMARGHAERIGGFVRDAMNEAGLAFGALDRIGVTVGPGSFTGLRVGLAFAQGLGVALDRRVAGVSTLHALALSSDDQSGETIALLDARRGQVYAERFRDGEPCDGPSPLELDEAAALVARYPQARLAGSGVSVVLPDREADWLAVTARGLSRATRLSDEPPWPAPLYLRAPDATPPTRLPGTPRRSPA